jgi:hypothetical protein
MGLKLTWPCEATMTMMQKIRHEMQGLQVGRPYSVQVSSCCSRPGAATVKTGAHWQTRNSIVINICSSGRI